MTDARYILCKRLMLGLFVGLALFVAMRMSQTWDEGDHLEYGEAVLHGHPDRTQNGHYYDSKMPVSALNALAPALADALSDRHIPPWLRDRLRELRAARMATIGFALLLALLVAAWSRELYGSEASVAALALYIVSPNLMAHSTLVTTDCYVTVAYFGTAYAHWLFAKAPSVRTAAIAAFALAVSQLTKGSAIFLFAIAPLLIAPAFYFHLRSGNSPSLWRPLRAYVALSAVLFVLAINIGFVCDRTFTPLSRYSFLSPAFQKLSKVPVLAAIPLPLPYPYLQGFDMLRHDEDTGLGYGNNYLLGECRPGTDRRPFRSYYLVCYLFKEPIALQLLMFAGLIGIAARGRWRSFLVNEWFLLIPVVVTLTVFSLFNNAQIGVRHILQIFPFTLLLAASNFRNWRALARRRKAVLAVSVAYAAVSVFSYYPHMIPYMNELVPDRRLAYKVLAESNLAWFQNTRIVRDFLRRNPDVVPILSKADPPNFVRGRILIDINLLVGVEGDPERFRWLRNHYSPVMHVGYGHLLYEVK